MYSYDDDHSHLINKAEIVAEEWKQRMAELAQKNPAKPVSETIKTIKLQAFAEHVNDPDFLLEIRYVWTHATQS